ncbi:hypothetical protein WISP_18399 [Willisornis vidua]|uniref:Uncharacterized protein n=1 Tax=Willisornis vidua TaxID=1566151 RepID=A0ABQ9DV11_9PASS|nr:hypothetical protein WISP_18399 [Willisornis vidua]
MVSTPDSDHKVVSSSLSAIRSRQISDAQQGQPRLVPVAVDSPEDFTVTVQARSAVADGPLDLNGDRPKGTQCPELEDHACENDQLPDEFEIVQDLVFQLDPYESMEPDEFHPRILKELADVIIKFSQ